jgi:NAD(P)-dependent dehydrogenase (short-subunit alcohol dehydrogenase family)
MKSDRLEGRVAIVTGVLGRLGPIWTEALLDAGASVLGLDLPGQKPPRQFTGLQGEYDRDRLGLVGADVRDRRSLEDARDHCLALFGAPSILVNNAGIDRPPAAGVTTYRLEEIPGEEFRGILEVNVLGVFQASQVFGAEMVKARRGSIVNIGSLYAAVAPDHRLYDHIPSDPPFLKPPAYGVSKAGVVNLTRYMATLWGPFGVRVNSLSPGGVLGGQDEEFRRKFCARVPLGRMAEPEDLKGPLLFLASDASSYVTGVDLIVDGGFTSW